MTRPAAVVFDLGGVLVDWHPRYLYERLMPAAEVAGFLDEIGFAAWNHDQDAGARSWADAVEELAREHPARRELIAAYPARFPETLRGAVPGTVEVLGDLHSEGVRLLALTNWSEETFRHARERFAFLDRFEAVVVSGEERLAKPDPRLFRRLLERYELSPGQTVFVDDSPRNVEAATAVGMVAVRFRDPDRLRADLTALGLLAAAPGDREDADRAGPGDRSGPSRTAT